MQNVVVSHIWPVDFELDTCFILCFFAIKCEFLCLSQTHSQVLQLKLIKGRSVLRYQLAKKVVCISKEFKSDLFIYLDQFPLLWQMKAESGPLPAHHTKLCFKAVQSNEKIFLFRSFQSYSNCTTKSRTIWKCIWCNRLEKSDLLLGKFYNIHQQRLDKIKKYI